MDKSVSASSASYIPMAVKSMTIFTIALMVIAIALVVIPGLATGGTAAAAGLDARYLETAKAEPDLDERDVFAAINRWTYDIYNTRSSAPGASGDGTTSSGVSGDGQAGSGVSDPGSPGGFSGAAALAYNWACLIDPVTAEIAAEWKKAMAGAETVAEKIAAIDAWNEQNMYHTQMTDYFKDMPGQDPWGVTLDGKPTFRKLLPSEMKAMTKLTGRISGKCMTLANLLAACLIHSGVRPDDIAIIHVQMPNFQHGAAIFNWDGEMARTNNHRMGMFYGTGGPPSFPPAPTPVIALYNSRFYNPGGFVSPAGCMDKGTFKADRALMPQVVTKCCGGVPIPEAACEAAFDFSDPAIFKRRLFEYDKAGGDGADAVPWLARYAYQSLYVKHPEYYLKASLREPHAKELAASCDGPVAMLEWMRKNLDSGSIFPDDGERLMTADQVIVFKTGGPADRGVLLWTLLKHKGIDSELILTGDTAVIHAGQVWCDMKTIQLTSPVEESEMIITL